jgi:hypothetical protein
VRSRDGVLVHANHCTDPALSLRDRNARDNPETLARSDRAGKLAAARPIDAELVCAILSDHATAPDSICRHVDRETPPEDREESVASLVFDLTGGTVDLADGPPCSGSYRRFTIADYLRQPELARA